MKPSLLNSKPVIKTKTKRTIHSQVKSVIEHILRKYVRNVFSIDVSKVQYEVNCIFYIRSNEMHNLPQTDLCQLEYYIKDERKEKLISNVQSGWLKIELNIFFSSNKNSYRVFKTPYVVEINSENETLNKKTENCFFKLRHYKFFL